MVDREEKIESTTIRSLTDFTEWLDSHAGKNKSQKDAFFYRGHADLSYELQPTAYRMYDGANYRLDESRLYQEMLRHSPLAFAEDTTVFERLARMQHHGLPTRLLDITENPLVALFFACVKEPEKNGSVLFFRLERQMVYHQSMLPDTSMVGVDKPLDFSQLGQQLYTSLKGFFEQEIESHKLGGINEELVILLTNCDKLNREAYENEVFADAVYYPRFLKELFTNTIKLCEDLLNDLKSKITTSDSNGEIENLKKQLSIEKFKNSLTDWNKAQVDEICIQAGIQNNRFELSMLLLQLTHIHFVLPTINNDRIRRQQGAFLIFSPIKSFWKVENWITPIGVNIEAGVKDKILKELASIGITHNHLFPGLDELAKEVCALYPRSKEYDSMTVI